MDDAQRVERELHRLPIFPLPGVVLLPHSLIPLQDELNTRLSDRANRIAMQSFKMYLGKHIENFADLPVTPGRMWSTDNADADVIEFGGDSACPGNPTGWCGRSGSANGIRMPPPPSRRSSGSSSSPSAPGARAQPLRRWSRWPGAPRSPGSWRTPWGRW